jgi:hypothetical protein
MTLTLPLLNVYEATVRERLSQGFFKDLQLNPPKRHYEKSQDLIGTKMSFQTPDQQQIKFISVTAGDCCVWCRRHVETPLVIPTKVLLLDGAYIVFGHGKFCCFEEAGECLKREMQFSSRSRNPNYKSSWSLLNWLFNLCYPGQTLKFANDYVIYWENEGKVLENHKLLPMQGLNIFESPLLYQIKEQMKT